MTAPTLPEFILARVAEDEETARAAICQCGGPACTPENGWINRGEARARLDGDGPVEFVLTFTPARVLAQCAAYRSIVALHDDWHECSGYDHTRQIDTCQWVDGEDCSTLRLLAVVWADHPNYREEWQ